MPRDSELAVVLVYPDLLGTYGDRGNALALTYRARARDLPVRLIEVAPDESAPASADLYLVGGGEDVSQALAWETLKAEKSIIAALQGGATCLAVCAGFQLLSREFRDRDGDMVAGLGLLDVVCARLPDRRAVGEVVAEPVGIPGLPTLSGYENHQGNAVLGPDAVRSAGSPAGSATATGRPRAPCRATWWPPTCTARCWCGTRRWPTTCWRRWPVRWPRCPTRRWSGCAGSGSPRRCAARKRKIRAFSTNFARLAAE